MPTNTVSWSQYAQKYDMLLEYNPFYQDLHKEVISKTKDWEIDPGDVILDLGAGTGNYSTALAIEFPRAQVIHVDRDGGMNAVAQAKKEEQQLENLRILTESVEDLRFMQNSFKAVTAIHSLYTFPNPHTVLSKIHDWLMPGGYGIFVDPGRLVKVREWQFAIGTRMIQKHGLFKTLEVMREGKEVSKQNQEISKLQANGTFWLHSHGEFLDAVSQVGFEILDAGTTFRGISDWVVVRK